MNSKFKKTSLIAVSALAITGLAFATPALAAPAKKAGVSATAQTMGKGHDHSFGSGKHRGSKAAHVSQQITVTVPDDGGTYKLVVSEVAPAPVSGVTPTVGRDKNKHSHIVSVTGTGSVTVTVPGLHPGDYTVELVKVSSTQTLTVTAPVAPAATTAK